MFIQELIDIHLHLPATDYPPAGEQFILGTAEPKVDITSYPGTPNCLFIVLFDQFIHIPIDQFYSKIPLSPPLKKGDDLEFAFYKGRLILITPLL